MYVTAVDGVPAAIVVDLAAGAAAPLATHPLEVAIRIVLLRPHPDGLRDASELDALAELEDRFTERLENAVDAIFVGHVLHAGATTLYYYAPLEHRELLERDLPSIVGGAGDYDPEWRVVEDADWKLYDELLAPGPYELQTILNRRVLEVFEQGNDRLDEPREVDHLAFFPSREHAERAGAALRAAGFDTETAELSDEPERGWSLPFHRVDALSDGRPDEFVCEILDIILDEDGDYDGWGAQRVGPALH